jgi:serine/threonine-protein kinase
MSIAPGQLIGSYRVVEKIGEGGMGAVYRAEDTAIQRSVVLKVLGTAMAGDAEMLQRFRREVEMIAGLEHPHILPVYEFGQVQGDPYIAMRFMRGGSLFDRMHEGRTSREKLLRLFDQVAEALDFAHDRDVIHRDLKPANVLLDESGNAYLADFGLAKTMEGSRDLTATGGILGTPAYMSPEQARGEKLDRRSDIYAFAVMAFEALSGQYPFVASTPMEYIYKHLSEPPRSILTLAADLPDAVDDVLREALAKEPDRRPARATEFMRRLRQALADAGAGQAATARRAAPAAPIGATSIRGREAAQAQQAGAIPVAAPGRGAGAASNASAVRTRRALPALLLVLAGGGVLLVLALGLGTLIFRESLFGPRVHTYPVGESPRSLVTDGQSVWVANFDADTVARLTATGCDATPDPCGQASRSYPVPILPVALVRQGDWLWVASALGRTLTRMDPDSGEQVAQYQLPNVPTAMIPAGEFLWIASEVAGSLTKVDLAGEVIGDYPLGMRPSALLWDGESLWVASEQDRLVAQIDIDSGQAVASYPVDGAPVALAFDGSYLWAALTDQDQLVKLDRSDGSVVAPVEVGATPRALLFDGSMIWSADQQGNRVTGVDPLTATVETTLRVPGGPYALAWVPCGPACGDLWIANEAADTVSRVRLP